MKTSSITRAAAVAATLYSGQSYANPVLLGRASPTIADWAGLIKPILEWFGVAFPEVQNAWEWDKSPQMCSVYMETKDGVDCKATVTCDDGTKEYNPGGATWNVCYVGGRQYFTDPRIGDFSITFTKKDGTEGEGLTDPILQLKDVNNWQEFPVSALAIAEDDYQDCKDHKGLNCAKGPFICRWHSTDNKSVFDSRTKKWECGMPKIGKGGAGIDSNAPNNDKGYAPGWCGFHVKQYQKPDPSKDQYSLEVTLKDANENEIGSSGKVGPSVSLTSKLPLTLEIKTGGVDADPVSFAYGSQSWDSNDGGRCSIGDYDSGARDMDCGFTCD